VYLALQASDLRLSDDTPVRPSVMLQGRCYRGDVTGEMVQGRWYRGDGAEEMIQGRWYRGDDTGEMAQGR
jgi:hypothetical protein